MLKVLVVVLSEIYIVLLRVLALESPTSNSKCLFLFSRRVYKLLIPGDLG